MRISLVFLAAVVVFLAGYGGVLSLEKSFDEASTDIEAAAIIQDGVLNGSEHVECTQNESEGEPAGMIQKEAQGDSITIGKVEFHTAIESGNALSKATGKPIFLYLHSKSCGWCKKFNDEVLTDNEVSATLKKNFISVIVEINEQKKVAASFNVRGTPTMVFLDEGGNEIDRIRGFVDAETFTQRLYEINDLQRRR